MKNNQNVFCIKKMAEVLEVSCSGYYDFLSKGKSKRELESERLNWTSDIHATSAN